MVGLALAVVQQVQHRVDQSPRQGVVRQAVENTRAIGESLDQTGVGHQLQMARDTRLALVQNARQLHHRQLFRRQQGQDAQAGRFAGGAQGLNGLVSGQRHGSYKDILIRLCKQNLALWDDGRPASGMDRSRNAKRTTRE
ncbi:hypothetical protein D3C73_1186910 [compost metagenome]